MNIADNHVVSIHYTLTGDDGTVIDSSRGREPLAYLHGAGNIVPGLEKQLTGRAPGDKLDVVVTPEEGYGVRHEGLVQTLPRDAFHGVDTIEPGMQFTAQGNRGPLEVTVTKVDGETVTIDGNHPLAGQALNFAVEIVDVREASKEELSHGHVHGPGGHHHH
jgi:FKBP-type peptidyl-prolyl cis-trans isomerase SlyD